MWQDYHIESPEDQQKFLLPLNKDTEKLYYNQRMIIDNRGIQTEPRAWQMTKVNRLTSNGIAVFTMKQDRFDQHKDWIEREDQNDPTSKIIGMWADGLQFVPQPPPGDKEVPIPLEIHAKISFSGTPVVKLGGSYKKFKVVVYKGVEEIPYEGGAWSFMIKLPDGTLVDATPYLSVRDTDESGAIKIKYIGDDTYLGNVLVLTNTTTEGTKSTCEVEITGL